MNKYQKIIDYDKHEAHYFCNENGIAMEVSKDIIIDELQEKINNAINYINDRVEDINNGGNESEYRSIVYINKILQGEDK